MISAHAEAHANPYGQRRRSSTRRLAGLLAGNMVRPLLVQLLEREEIREFVIHHLSNKLAMNNSSLERALPADLDAIHGFEDCYWLFSSNKLNHGLIRHSIEEAAFLYRLARQMDHPKVVELGRFKGGGTILLAAAGAQVMSLDNDEIPGQTEYTEALERALKKMGLMDQVENVMGDAFTYSCQSESVDLVFNDFLTDGEGIRASFEHWWPAVKPGGYFLMGDGKCSPLLEVVEYVTHLDIESLGGSRVPGCPGAFVLFQKHVA